MSDKFNEETTATEAAQFHSSRIANKVILTTGVSPNSLGAAFNAAIAPQKPALLILAGRSREKIQQTADDIAKSNPDVKTRLLVLDLANQKQVREAAKEVLAYEENIDVLVNNAAIMAQPYAQTVDGIEAQFGTNHIGHFLFTNLIASKLFASPEPRIVNVSSDGYRLHSVRFDDPNWTEKDSYNSWLAYGQAKTANILFSKSLATVALPNDSSRTLQAFSLHPGVIWTNLGAHLTEKDLEAFAQVAEGTGMPSSIDQIKMKSQDQGASTHVVAAFDPEIGKTSNGAYLEDAQVNDQVREYTTDPENAKKLWTLSEKLLGEKFDLGQAR